MSFQPTIGQGAKDVATAGTALALTASATFVLSVTIQAKPDNSGRVFIGTSAVDAATGISLAAGETMSYRPPNGAQGLTPVVNLADFYVDCESSNTDGITFLYVTTEYNQHAS